MRIRCSKGVRVNSFHGHFFIQSSDLMSMPQARTRPCGHLLQCRLAISTPDAAALSCGRAALLLLRHTAASEKTAFVPSPGAAQLLHDALAVCTHILTFEPVLQVDSDKGFAVQMTIEEGLVTERATCIQCGLVYTASDGERRIRHVLAHHTSVLKRNSTLSVLIGVGGHVAVVSFCL